MLASSRDEPKSHNLNFKPHGAVLKDFMRGTAFVRGIRGPIGSGKSAGCCMEIMRRACEQEPGPDGVRRSRWGVVRNTNPQLRTTTIKTWLDWFPEEIFGDFKWSVPYTHMIRFGDVELEVIFMALDRPDDVGKLLSIEFTGIFVNEAREVAKAIVDACTMRVGRFPSMKDGGPTWYGVIMDTNAPDEDHWWSIMSGEVPLPDYLTEEESLMLVQPDNWEFYNQPPGMVEEKDGEGQVTGYAVNDNGENVINLVPTYYSNLIRGKTKSWIDVYVMNRIGFVSDGKPVHPNFVRDFHVAKQSLEPAAGVPLLIGMDFGLTPAALFGQRLPTGRWLILAELVASNMGTEKFADEIKHVLAKKFPEHFAKAMIYGDPAGDHRAQTDEKTPYSVLRAARLKAYPTQTNDPSIRLDTVDRVLTRIVGGKPGLLVDPSCSMFIRGLEGGYCYDRIQASGSSERFHETPSKNKFSHVCDASQYLLLGGGEWLEMVGRKPRGGKPINAKGHWDPFDRQKKVMGQNRREKDWDRILRRGT